MMVVKEPSPLYFNLKEARHLSEVCSWAQHFPFWKTNQFHVGELHFGLGLVVLIKVHIVKAMVFPVVTYGYKSWTITKAEH